MNIKQINWGYLALSLLAALTLWESVIKPKILSCAFLPPPMFWIIWPLPI